MSGCTSASQLSMSYGVRLCGMYRLNQRFGSTNHPSFLRFRDLCFKLTFKTLAARREKGGDQLRSLATHIIELQVIVP